jgi:hypothetical protein
MLPATSHATSSANQQLKRQVTVALAQYSQSLRERVNVTVASGAVTLRGQATGDFERKYAEMLIWRVPGVRDVRNLLSTSGNQPANAKQQIDAQEDRIRTSWVIAGFAAVVIIAAIAVQMPHRQKSAELYEIRGTVRIANKPAAAAQLVLHPIDGATCAPCPRAQADSQGNFVISTFAKGDGAPPGKYRVTAECFTAVGTGDDVKFVSILPPAFSKPSSTPLELDVERGNNALVQLDLSSKTRQQLR